MSPKSWIKATAATAVAIPSLVFFVACAQPTPNPTGSQTPSPTDSQTASPSPTSTPTSTSTPSPSPSFTPGVDVIFIDSPLDGDTVTQTSVRVSGRASVFEAQFQFKLYRDGKLLKSGTTQATVGSPELGDWKVDLDGLTVGDYKFTAFDTSEKDGSVILETTIEFLVRLDD